MMNGMGFCPVQLLLFEAERIIILSQAEQNETLQLIETY